MGKSPYVDGACDAFDLVIASLEPHKSSWRGADVSSLIAMVRDLKWKLVKMEMDANADGKTVQKIGPKD